MQNTKILLFASSFLALALASCNNQDNHTPGAATSDPTITSQQAGTSEAKSSSGDTSTPATSVTSQGEQSQAGEQITLNGLNVYVFKTFMDDGNVTKVRASFDAYCSQQNVTITNQVWEGDSSAKVAGFDAAVKAYEEDTTKPNIDIILGAKGNLGAGTFVGDHFTALTNADETYVTMSTFVGEEEKTERRIYVSNTVEHLDAVKLLVKHVANFDIPEEGGEGSQTSEASTPTESDPVVTSEESQPGVTSEESQPGVTSEESQPGVTSEESQPVVTSEESQPGETSEGSEPATVLDEITVYCYENSVTEEQKNDLKLAFENYLVEQNVTITVNEWVLGTTGKMAALESTIEAYNDGHEGHEVDIVLGARAALSSEYMTANYSYAGNDDADGRMTIGSSSNRRVLYNTNTANQEAVEYLVNCFLPNLSFSFAA